MTSSVCRECREQRLRLGDLRHFRSRRKAFERRREDGVGVGGAAGRLIEFGQRERRAQFEAARALLLRDGDGRQERVFRRRGISGVALQQDVAADAMQFRLERAMTDALARRQRLVEDRDSAVGVACVRFGFGQRNLQEPVEQQDVLFAQQLDAAAHVLEPAPEPPCLAAVAKPSRNTPNARHMGRSCSRASRASSTAFGAARDESPRISSNRAACIFPFACVPIW